MNRKTFAAVAVAALTTTLALGLPGAAQAAAPSVAGCSETRRICIESGPAIARCLFDPSACPWKHDNDPWLGGPDIDSPWHPDRMKPWERELLLPGSMADMPFDLASGHE